ncbi:hypothetical protein CXG81DRAFT_23183 [Caulochytrium protostelioides]|uniref:HCP-like protein n=1 Tax=Caulochytrium protostelioides TaxID=1555241 RepID=A0A4V1IVJ0_9FUNG|nr:hypothetical protein CXG81DRAFT_23183 [Caulochytrium protostelioides]|eukprot:RKP04229.1 hypothetical protein CXG81DRAFT_23183 [Caulochytrium protostelioides]
MAAAAAAARQPPARPFFSWWKSRKPSSTLSSATQNEVVSAKTIAYLPPQPLLAGLLDRGYWRLPLKTVLFATHLVVNAPAGTAPATGASTASTAPSTAPSTTPDALPDIVMDQILALERAPAPSPPPSPSPSPSPSPTPQEDADPLHDWVKLAMILGRTTPAGQVPAFRFLQALAARGSGEARLQLALWHVRGGVASPSAASPSAASPEIALSKDVGLQMLAALADAAPGHPAAQYILSQQLEQQITDPSQATPERTDRVMRLLLAAADGGHAMACAQIGQLYLRGGRHAEARRYLARAADRDVAEAWFLLGTLAADETAGRTPDAAEAFRCYVRAATQGLAVAQHNVGAAYLAGAGVARSVQDAVAYFEMAASQGFPLSLANLVKLYTEGTLVPADAAKAAHYQAQLDAPLPPSVQALDPTGRRVSA